MSTRLGIEPFPKHLVSVSGENLLEKNLSKEKLLVLYGGESSGKRTVMQLFIEKHLGNAYSVVWMQASSSSNLLLSCRKIVQGIGATQYTSNFYKQIAKISLFFETNPCLLVMDGLSRQLFKATPLLQKLFEKAQKVVVLTQDPDWNLEKMVMDHLTEDEALSLLEETIHRKLWKDEGKALRNFISIALHSPTGLILFGNYYLACVSRDSLLTWKKYLEHLDIDYLNVHHIEKQIMKKILSYLNLYPDTLRLLKVCAYLHSKKIPIALLELHFPKMGAQHTVYKSLHHLSRLGIVQAPFSDPALDFRQYCQLPSAQLTINVPSRFQRAVRELQKDNLALQEALSLIKLTKKLNHRNYDKNVRASEVDDELLFPHVETVLKHVREAKFNDWNELYLQCKLSNTWGRYFQMQDQFALALDYYSKGLKAMRDSPLQRQENANLVKWISLQTMLSHNYGSACLRIWHQIDTETKKYANDCLEYALKNYQQPKVAHRLTTGDRETHPLDEQTRTEIEKEDYANLHFRYFTLRAHARMLKADGKLKRAKEIFKELYTRKEYIQWPQGHPVSETKPLALMDRGVIEYLLEEKRLKSLALISPRSLTSSSVSEKFRNSNQLKKSTSDTEWMPSESYRMAFGYLSKSVKLYKSENYLFPNRKKDLSVALSRLGEFYLSLLQFCRQEEVDRISNNAELVFQESLQNICEYNRERQFLAPSNQEARCHYRLAEVYTKQGKLMKALHEVKKAIELQEDLYEPGHRYLEASKNLKDTLTKRLQHYSKKLTTPVSFSSSGLLDLSQIPNISKPHAKNSGLRGASQSDQVALDLKGVYDLDAKSFDFASFGNQPVTIQRRFLSLFNVETDVIKFINNPALENKIVVLRLHLQQLCDSLSSANQMAIEMSSSLNRVYKYLFNSLVSDPNLRNLEYSNHIAFSTDLASHKTQLAGLLDSANSENQILDQEIITLIGANKDAEKSLMELESQLKTLEEKQKDSASKIINSLAEKIKTQNIIKEKITSYEILLEALEAVLDVEWESIYTTHLEKAKELYAFFSQSNNPTENETLKIYNSYMELLEKIRSNGSTKKYYQDLLAARNLILVKILIRLNEASLMASLMDSIPSKILSILENSDWKNSALHFQAALKIKIDNLDKEVRVLKHRKENPEIQIEKDAQSNLLSEFLKSFCETLMDDPKIKKLIKEMAENFKLYLQKDENSIIAMFAELRKLQIGVKQDLEAATIMSPRGKSLLNQCQIEACQLVRTLIKTAKEFSL